MAVVLPDPFGPSRPTTAPAGTSISNPRSACTGRPRPLANTMGRSSKRTTADGAGAGAAVGTGSADVGIEGGGLGVEGPEGHHLEPERRVAHDPLLDSSLPADEERGGQRGEATPRLDLALLVDEEPQLLETQVIELLADLPRLPGVAHDPH